MRQPNLAYRPRAGTFHTLALLPDGSDAATRATLRVMRDVTRSAKKEPQIRELAMRITAGCPNKAFGCQVQKLHAWVQRNIRYVGDVYEVETVSTPEVTLRNGGGDCDDHAVLLAALLQSIGHPVRFVAVAVGNVPAFSHVFCETKIGGYWRACETTEPWPVGRYPSGVRRTMFQNV